MFACLYSVSSPLASLVTLAEAFTPRFEVVGPLVILDVAGLSRLIGTPREIGEQLRRSADGPVRIALAPTQTAAALLALGRAGLTVVDADDQTSMLGALPVGLLGDLDRLRLAPSAAAPPAAVVKETPSAAPPSVGEMWDALPYFESTLDRTSDLAVKAHGGGCGGGWKHPRDSHAAEGVKTRKSGVRSATSEALSATSDVRRASPEALMPTTHSALGTPHSALRTAHSALSTPDSRLRTAHSALRTSHSALRTPDSGLRTRRALTTISTLQSTLRRWGIKTCAALAVLPPGDVYERLGAHGVFWQRVARGEDSTPLVPWVPEEPFEAALDLEWPIEGLEPLSFVLGRLLEPLAERLERADRGAAVIHTHLRLVSKDVHARALQLPAPMRDPKTLRTLILLDLESNPPAAAIDRVRLLLEPTPARVLQWRLFERAQTSPEQVSTLLARLTALMGETHVGSPRLVDSWKPGVFEMMAFTGGEGAEGSEGAEANGSEGIEGREGIESRPSPAPRAPATALRRFRLPVPVRVQVVEGRPVRVMSDRRGVGGGAIVQAAGPWRTSGEWWNDGGAQVPQVPRVPRVPRVQGPPQSWDRDEWDIAIADGTLYRLYVERDVGQWFIEGVVD